MCVVLHMHSYIYIYIYSIMCVYIYIERALCIYVYIYIYIYIYSIIYLRVIIPGERLMRTLYRTCFHTLYDEKKFVLLIYVGSIIHVCVYIHYFMLLRIKL